MYVRVGFSIPEEGEMTLIAKIAGVVEYPSGSRVFTFETGLHLWTDEGYEKFTAVSTSSKYRDLITEKGDYRVNSLEFIAESEFIKECAVTAIVD